jgi:hypothetical protein
MRRPLVTLGMCTVLAACGGGGSAVVTQQPDSVANSSSADAAPAVEDWTGEWSGTLAFQGAVGNSCGSAPSADPTFATAPFAVTVTELQPSDFHFAFTTPLRISDGGRFLAETKFQVSFGAGSLFWGLEAQLLTPTTMQVKLTNSERFLGGLGCDYTWMGTIAKPT